MLKRLRQRAFQEGIIGGSTPWMVVGALTWGVYAVQWAMRKKPEVVYRTRLKPGEQLVISARPPKRR
jgi:hypothetical protein